MVDEKISQQFRLKKIDKTKKILFWKNKAKWIDE